MQLALKNPRIGIAAPAGPPLDGRRLAQGLRNLEAQGLTLIRPRETYPTHGFLAGDDCARLEEFNALIARPDLDVILCVRGGYGALRLLDGLDYETAKRYPKVLVGYSDITALQLALHRRAGWPGLSGAMAAVEWPEPDDRWLEPYARLLRGETEVSLGPVDGSVPVPVVDGQAEAPLIGGNLATMTRLVGTPYMPNLAGSILFLEDVGELPYRIDALLAQLRLAGHLDNLAGAVLGQFTDAESPADRPSFTVEEVLDHYFRGAPYPVVRNWNYGHFPLKAPLPIGPRARLTVREGGASLTTLEPLLPSL
ncbi:MAG: LD-carboxypeptidase [Rhodothermales bacterium]|nr:LD-carboxypeptidase [Rhodothermales bacterium]